MRTDVNFFDFLLIFRAWSEDNLRLQPKFIVFLSRLLLLFKVCPVCKSDSPVVSSKETGTMIEVRTICKNKECPKPVNIWASQPLMPGTRMAAGNFLLCFSILLSGSSASKVLQLFKHMGVACISLRTYFRHQRVSALPLRGDFVYVWKLWNFSQPWHGPFYTHTKSTLFYTSSKTYIRTKTVCDSTRNCKNNKGKLNGHGRHHQVMFVVPFLPSFSPSLLSLSLPQAYITFHILSNVQLCLLQSKLFPTVYLFWKKYQQQMFQKLKDTKEDLVIAGDGRHDSMGHSAKYCAYTVFACTIPLIITFSLVQVRT